MKRSVLLLALAGCSAREPPPVLPPLVDQDVDGSERAVADRAIEILTGMDNVAMVMLRRDDRYEVHAKDGAVIFERRSEEDGYRYPIVSHTGRDPLEAQDPAALSDLESELGAGENPMGTDYRSMDPGYGGPSDRRISFLRADQVTYPLAYPRIAALFDGEHAGDLVVEFTPWGYYPLGKHDGLSNPGAHGQLNVIASRAPLIIAGKGARPGQQIEGWARSVDIAPTAAKAMGIQRRFGVDEHGRTTLDNYLAWQDGHPLDEALDGGTASRVLIIVNDALTNNQLDAQLAGGAPLSAYRWLLEHGTRYRHGAVTNFPSNTFASHNTIGSGAYSGHHGLIDNWFYDRREQRRHDPLTEVLDTGRFVSDRVETLHQAVHRSFGNWDPKTNPLGNFTMAINTPATKGADHALLEGVQPIDFDRCPEPADLGLPPLDERISTRSQGADNLALSIFAKGVLGRHADGSRCAHPPRLVILNLGLTDDVAHETGPHSDSMTLAIEQTNRRMEILFDLLRRAGWLDDTMVILTSDHGQCLQDTARSADFRPALEAAGIRAVVTNTFLYLLTLDVRAQADTLERGETAAIEVVVLDDDTQTPVAGAKVRAISGSAVADGTTDAEGRAQLRLDLQVDGFDLEVASPDHTTDSRTYRKGE
jgi:predicted AlkP superfamily pyrophosphatase or phosphodiesterase